MMNKMNEEMIAALSLHTHLVGSKSLWMLRNHFGSYVGALNQSSDELLKAKLTPKQVASIAEVKAQIKQQLAIITEQKIKVLVRGVTPFPEGLLQMTDPPSIIYYKGEVRAAPSISIVGTRRATSYGQRATQEFATAMARTGITVVSGLAYGIDGIAHRSTLEAGGHTLAVLPCGIDKIYPAGHRHLAEQIIEQGALVSEFPIGMTAYKGSFLFRNRIIAGLSRATVVVEAPYKSGALVTGSLAFGYHRDVFAVPGDIYQASSVGTNWLIEHQMATPLNRVDQLTEYYGVVQAASVPVNLDEIEQRIYDAIPMQGAQINQLANLLQLDIVVLSSKVIMLELKGCIRGEGGGLYCRI